MKFIVSSSELLKNLQVLSSILNTNNTLPILDNFLFYIDQNNLNITSSDLETTLSSNINVESTITSKIAIPAKLLLDIIRNLPSQPLTFSINDNNTIEINSNNGKYAIAVRDTGFLVIKANAPTNNYRYQEKKIRIRNKKGDFYSTDIWLIPK